jgi:LuxR family maltose regulon positive regulatory protein
VAYLKEDHMTVPLLQTKLCMPPVRPEWVSRPHLVERLNAGLDRKLTLVSAAAGFGKTTLVVEWLSGIDRLHTWLSLEKSDNDPVRFTSYLVAALQRADEKIGLATSALLATPQLPAVDLAMTTLINDVAVSPVPFVLVLDDYHILHEGWIHSAVEYLLTHQPRQLHLVLITRTDPPLPLPRLRVRGQVTEIRAEDLRFTHQESSAFFNRMLGETPGAEVVAALDARTEGWIAALHLAALQLAALARSTCGTDPEVLSDFIVAFSGSHRHVIAYLADEVLAQQSVEIRRFLYQTAILDRLTAPLCEAVTGRADSAAILARLERANLFLVPLDERREWYRYHALFRDFLRTELDPEARAALHGKAARWYVEQNLLPEAVQHALASGEVALAAQVIARAAEEAFRTASIATLAGWLDALPEEVVRDHAELATYKGLVLYLRDRRAEAVTYADAAEQRLPADAPQPSRGRLYCLKAHAALCTDLPSVATQWSRKALACLDEDDALYRDLTLNVLGQALEQEGDTAAAAEVYRDAFALRRKTGNQFGTIVVLTNLAFALNDLGRRREARELCQQVVTEGGTGAGSASVTDGAYLAWSLLSFEANELDLAREQAGRALALCRQAQISDGVWWAQYILARTHLAKGELDEVRRICREMRQRDARVNQDLYGPWFAAIEAQASLQASDPLGAEHWIQAAGLTPDDVPHRWNEYPYVVYVRLLLARDRLEDAQKLLATMEGTAVQSKRLRSLITVRLQQALLHRALSRQKQTQGRVEEAVRLAAPQDYRRAFLDEGSPLIELLPHVRHIAPKFVDSLLSVFPQESVGAPRPSPLVEPLTGREREILRLIAAGRSNPEIAELLYLSLNTVKWHAKNLYGKLGVGNRVQAVARAEELHLL